MVHQQVAVGMSCFISTNDTIKTAHFAYFHSIVKYAEIFWGNSVNIKVFSLQKRILKVMMGLGLRCSCRELFKKLSILPVPHLYMLSLMTFIVDNPDKFQSNSSLLSFTRRHKDHLYIPRVNLSCMQKGVTYCALKVFHSLPLDVSRLTIDKLNYKMVLRRYLITLFTVLKISSLIIKNHCNLVHKNLERKNQKPIH